MQKKYLTKSNTLSWSTPLSKLKIEEKVFNPIKNIYQKTPLWFTGEKIAAFSLRLWTRQGCPLSPLLRNIILDVLEDAIRQEKEIKGIQTGREDIKLSLFIDDMIVYVENTKESAKKKPGANNQLW